MPRIYTEIRIHHKSLEEKASYEEELDKALKRTAYGSRSEWARDMVRNVIEEARRLDRESEIIKNWLKGEKE